MTEHTHAHHLHEMSSGPSLAVQWSGLPLQGVGVQCLVGELRSCKPHSTAKSVFFFLTFNLKKKKEMSRIGISIEAENRQLISRGWREERTEGSFLIGAGSLFGMMKKFWN